MTWLKTNGKSLFLAAVGFFTVLILIYVYLFVFSKIKFLSKEMGSATKSIIILDEKKKDFELAKSNLEKQNENIAVLESAFLSESVFVDFLNNFEDIAKKAGAKFKAKGASLPDSSGRAQISFEISGSFESIAKFLTLLDTIRYSGIINKFSLFKDSDDSGLLTASADYLLFNFK